MKFEAVIGVHSSFYYASTNVKEDVAPLWKLELDRILEHTNSRIEISAIISDCNVIHRNSHMYSIGEPCAYISGAYLGYRDYVDLWKKHIRDACINIGKKLKQDHIVLVFMETDQEHVIILNEQGR